MRPKCKFCNCEIHGDHYFITKNGSICLKCKEKIRNEIRSISPVSNSVRADSDRTKGKVG